MPQVMVTFTVGNTNIWLFHIAIENMALIEIDDVPSERNLHFDGPGIFHGEL